MKKLTVIAAVAVAAAAYAKPVVVTTETGMRTFIDSEDLLAVCAPTPDTCAAVVAPKLEILWADYTNRMERLRIREERMKAARVARGENVDGRPPAGPWRMKQPGKRIPSRKGGAK